MAQIQIGRADAIRLYQYCCAYGVQWFVVKNEHGAYVTATRIPEPVRYFAGCNPGIHSDWKTTADLLFGQDDYCEVLPLDWLRKLFNDDTINRVQINVDNERLSADFLRSSL